MEIVRLRRPRHSSSKVEELLESYISQSELVPKGSYRIRELDSVPREVRKSLVQAVKDGQTWSCRAHGLHIWLFTCNISRPLSRECGAPVLQVRLYGDDGGLRDSGAWMPDQCGKWCRSGYRE
jgi:hypothetical protein